MNRLYPKTAKQEGREVMCLAFQPITGAFLHFEFPVSFSQLSYDVLILSHSILQQFQEYQSRTPPLGLAVSSCTHFKENIQQENQFHGFVEFKTPHMGHGGKFPCILDHDTN
jgi:hypothetical protein